jgi:uncharacterized membrane protein
MAPLITLTLATLALLAIGAAGVQRLKSWAVALRGGLAAMFFMTGISHFVGMRSELVSMVPPALPAPEMLVTVTGILELMGAAALLSRRAAPWAAAGLAVLLVVMFPANIYAAREGLATSTGDNLALRTSIQVIFLIATLAITANHVRGRQRTSA